MNEDTEKLLMLIAICLIAGTVGTLLASGWYRVTQKDQPDRNTVFVFAKIFFGMGGVTIIAYLILKYL